MKVSDGAHHYLLRKDSLKLMLFRSMGIGILCALVESCEGITQARKLSCLLEEGIDEANDGWSPKGVNVFRRQQSRQVVCGDFDMKKA